MVKVITYGTFDLLHYGHRRLLERARALGDYLIVGVTSDDYDKTRGKINNNQSLMERVASVKALGIADEVIIEEYEGQKIDDIRKYNIDIFTVGSDWEGKFDYLKSFCDVIYLPRTEGISSSAIRSENVHLQIGLIGDAQSDLSSLPKFLREVKYVNGIKVTIANVPVEGLEIIDDIDDILKRVDSVYIAVHPSKHYTYVKKALERGIHVLCESPIALKEKECEELFQLAHRNHCILMESLKTAYTVAFERLVLLSKTGAIGKILSVDATCTSKKDFSSYTPKDYDVNWNTITEWGPVSLLPVFQILGCDYNSMNIVTKYICAEQKYDIFTKIDFIYSSAVASIKIAKGAKSEGELIVTGTEGYIFVPAPWWKTDYFEIRYENASNNRRYFYQLDGEGIRYEIVEFVRAISKMDGRFQISEDVSIGICKIMESFYSGKNVTRI